jgi:hypothetical protein
MFEELRVPGSNLKCTVKHGGERLMVWGCFSNRAMVK